MKIFVLLSRFPYPLEKGDKLRAYHQLKYLAKNNEIHLCALTDVDVKQEHIQQVASFCKTIHTEKLSGFSIFINILKAFITGKPLQVGYFYNSNVHRRITDLISGIQPDHIYCQLIRVAEYVRFTDKPKTIDYQDVLSKGMQRRMETSPVLWKPLLKLEYHRLLKYEHRVFSWFNHKTIISKPDRDLIPHPDRDQIEVVINGVDTDFFKPVKREKTYDIVFTGNMGYPPNVNASKFLVNEVLPLVTRLRPQIKVMLAGATPHPGVQALANDHVHVTGWVEDIRECYAHAKLFIAPMQIGTGLQNKLLEAMAMQIPAITSPLANDALNARDGKEILIGKTPQDYADHILKLLEDPMQNEYIARNGYHFVHRHYNWVAATKKLEDLISSRNG
jgi:sugar transferase (PEP-CTERM/EpsH1 system associated)